MNTNTIKLAPVDSSQIEAIGHDPETNTLAIKFKGGGVYHYANVSEEVFHEFSGEKLAADEKVKHSVGERAKHPLYLAMTPISVSAPGERYHHQSGPSALNPAFLALLDVGKVADLLLQEEWKGRCEIIPNYMAPFEKPEARKTSCVVRYHWAARSENQEDSYSYLRYSHGPQQGFFWDCYGDDMGTPELALLALHQAPCPVYTGPLVFKIKLS